MRPSQKLNEEFIKEDLIRELVFELGKSAASPLAQQPAFLMVPNGVGDSFRAIQEEALR